MSVLANVDAERSLISCLLTSPEAWDDRGKLCKEDFHVPAYGAIYDAISALRSNGSYVDFVTVGDALERAGTVNLLTATGETLSYIGGYAPSPLAVRHYADIVRECKSRRKIALAASELDRRAKDNGTDINALILAAKGQLEGAVPASDEDELAHVGKLVPGFLKQLEERADGKGGHVLSTGLSDLDRCIGGFKNGQLIVVAARPGMGKSAFATGIAMKAAIRGTATAIFSLEMTRQELMERITIAHMRLPLAKLMSGIRDKNIYSRIYSEMEWTNDGPLFIDDRPLGMAEIVASSLAWRKRHKDSNGLIVIDYLGLIRPSEKSETRTLEVGRMAWACKVLAKQCACSVVLVAQLNRQSEIQKRPPVLSDLRDSGEIEQHADMVLFPHREPPYHESGPAKIIVAKNRSGPGGIIPCHWHAELMSFENSTMDTESSAW